MLFGSAGFRMKIRSIPTLLCLLATALRAETFSDLTERYFREAYFRFAPSAGTAAGFHEYDTKLEDYSKAARDDEIKILRAFEPKFGNAQANFDRDLVLSNIRARLLELRDIQIGRAS